MDFESRATQQQELDTKCKMFRPSTRNHIWMRCTPSTRTKRREMGTRCHEALSCCILHVCNILEKCLENVVKQDNTVLYMRAQKTCPPSLQNNPKTQKEYLERVWTDIDAWEGVKEEVVPSRPRLKHCPRDQESADARHYLRSHAIGVRYRSQQMSSLSGFPRLRWKQNGE